MSLGPLHCPCLGRKVSSLHPDAHDYWRSLGYSQTSKDHSSCTKNECIANDLEVEQYVTQHVDEKCECELVGPNAEDIADIYANTNGSFPLVALKKISVKGRDHFEVHVRAYESSDEFIAISHALSDGLGNPKRPALPICRLKQIESWVKECFETRIAKGHTKPFMQVRPEADASECQDLKWFWIDTLCVPSHAAIDTIYDIQTRRSFKRATCLSLGTLVIDQDILRLKPGFLYDEAYMRLVFSSWFSRMWTLQEAVMTPMTVFQINGGTAELGDMGCLLESTGSRLGLDDTPFQELIELRRYMMDPLYETLRGGNAHRALLHKALSERRTSYELDRYIIWSNMIA